MTTQPAPFDFTFGIQVGQLVVSGYENKRFVYRVVGVERRYYTSQDRCLPRGAQVGDEYNALVRLEKVLKPDMTPIKKPGNPVTFDACYIIPFTNAYIDEQIAALQAQINAYNIARTLLSAPPQASAQQLVRAAKPSKTAAWAAAVRQLITTHAVQEPYRADLESLAGDLEQTTPRSTRRLEELAEELGAVRGGLLQQTAARNPAAAEAIDAIAGQIDAHLGV